MGDHLQIIDYLRREEREGGTESGGRGEERREGQ
jgi:hypothetical protein